MVKPVILIRISNNLNDETDYINLNGGQISINVIDYIKDRRGKGVAKIVVRMTDVAQLANVSSATVSRVLSNSDKVNEETKKRVLDVIKDLNYQPNVLARQLRTMKTQTVIVVVPDITNTFFSKVLRGIENVAIQNGYQVFLGDTDNNVHRENEYLDLLGKKHAEGMILLTARTERHILDEVSKKYPIVLACEYVDGSEIPVVSIDNIGSARKATEHLIKLGHQRIAHISGPMEIVLSRDRLKGYELAMEQYNTKLVSWLIEEGDFSFESGYKAMNKFLRLEKIPSAVFAANDEMAMGAIKATTDNGLRVPQDVACVGFDNIKFASIFEPHLTTISQPSFEIGMKAMELLLKLINKEEILERKVILDETLIIRKSCGAKL